MARTKTDSRASKVRARRKSTASSPKRKGRGKSSVEARYVPPVLVRGEMMASRSGRKSKRKSKKKSVKRRYDIALSTPGVEVRLPVRG